MSSSPPVPRKRQKTINWVLVYTTTITLLGAVIMAAALLNLPQDWVGVLVFSFMVVIAEVASVELFHTSRSSSVSVSMIVTLAAVIYFGPLTGVLIQIAVGVANTITATIKGRNAETKNRASFFRRSTFNMGMFAISTAFSGWVYLLTGGTVGDVMHASNILPILFASATDIFTNIALLLGVISLQTGDNPITIWKQDFQWAAQIGFLAEAVGGAALAMAYQMEKILGSLVFFLPVLTIGLSFRTYANNMRGYIDSLEELNNELNETNYGLLETLSAVIDAYDIFTAGHSSQVAVYAEALAKQMGLPPGEQELIVKAALVHDIGKIGISDDIIGKPGPLGPDEIILMRRHPTIGAEILGQTKGLKDLVPLVRCHHEKYDGSGYPAGLKTEAIPLGARIITLADCLDAMLSDRAYRPSLNLTDVIEYFRDNSGRHFDPQVVAAFFQMVAEKGPEFFINSSQVVDRNVLLLKLGEEMVGAKRFLKKSALGAQEE